MGLETKKQQKCLYHIPIKQIPCSWDILVIQICLGESVRAITLYIHITSSFMRTYYIIIDVTLGDFTKPELVLVLGLTPG